MTRNVRRGQATASSATKAAPGQEMLERVEDHEHLAPTQIVSKRFGDWLSDCRDLQPRAISEGTRSGSLVTASGTKKTPSANPAPA